MKNSPVGPVLTLLLLFSIGLLGEVDYQVIPPLLPLLAADFQVPPSNAAQAIPIYAIASAVFSLVFGYLSDHLGRKPVIQAGLLSFAAASLCNYASPSLQVFFVGRFFSGVTAGAVSTAATSYAADYFRYEHRGKAMGVLSTAYFAAAIIGIPSATAIASRWGWRSIAFAIFVFGIIASGLVWKLLQPETPLQVREIDAHNRLSAFRIQQVLRLCLHQRGTISILLASMLSSGAVVGFITFLSIHLTTTQHVTVRQVGLVFLLCGAASLVGAPLSGIVADRWAKKPLLVLSGLVLSGCVVVIPQLGWNFSLFAALAFAGLSIAFRMAPLLALTTELVSAEYRGTFLALRNALSQLGIAGSVLVASYCYAIRGYALVGGFSATLLIASTLLVVFLVPEPREYSPVQSDQTRTERV